MYTVLREAEYRSTAFVPYWNVPLLRWLVPRQRRCTAALAVVNQALDALISKCKRLVRAGVWCTSSLCLWPHRIPAWHQGKRHWGRIWESLPRRYEA